MSSRSASSKTTKRSRTGKKKGEVIDLAKIAKEKGLTLLPSGKAKNIKLDVASSTLDNLKAQLAMTFDLLPIAEAAYRKYPHERNALAVTRLVETAVALMEKIEEHSTEGITERIAEKVLRPLVTDTVAALSQELRALRDELKLKVSKDQQHTIDRLVREVLGRVGNRLDQTYKEAVEELQKVIALK